MEGEKKIQRTEDYSQLKFTKFNRSIDHHKVQRFVQESKLNPHLMEICPILVNGDMEIIDGQHRFLACKENKLPVFFIQCDKLKYSDIIVLNKDQKNWNLDDYISHHVQAGNINFIKLLDFSKKTCLSISLSCLFLGFNRKNLVSCIKQGTLVFPDEHTENQAILKIEQMAIFKRSLRLNSKDDVKVRCLFTYTFIESISHLPNTIDICKFFQDLYKNIDKLQTSNSWSHYHMQFSDLRLM
jgi:hypothetical protein